MDRPPDSGPAYLDPASSRRRGMRGRTDGAYLRVAIAPGSLICPAAPWDHSLRRAPGVVPRDARNTRVKWL